MRKSGVSNGKVAAVLSDLETAPIRELLKSTLRMIGMLTQQNSVSVGDMRAVLGAGASREQIKMRWLSVSRSPFIVAANTRSLIIPEQ